MRHLAVEFKTKVFSFTGSLYIEIWQLTTDCQKQSITVQTSPSDKPSTIIANVRLLNCIINLFKFLKNTLINDSYER